jgi:hypothetical protein
VTTPHSVLGALRKAVAALARPLTDEDRESRWTDDDRTSVLHWLSGLLSRAERGEDVRGDTRMIGRTLDEIDSGPLYEVVIAVQRVARGE